MGAGRRFVRSVSAALIRLTPVLALAACRDDPTRTNSPFTIEASLSGDPEVIVGTVVTPSPTFVVRNSQGEALANLPVTITITKGDGTLRNVPLRTGTTPTTIGEWTLDTIAGVNEIRIVAGDALPVTVAVTGHAGPPVSVTTVVPLDGLAGDVLPGLFALRVRDQYGNPVPGVEVDLAIEQGGGDVSPLSVTTDNEGLASGISWRLGRSGGSQLLTATVGSLSTGIPASIRSSFNPVIRVIGNTLPASLAEAFQLATDRLHGAIIGDLSDVPVLNLDVSRCGLQAGTLTENVDDLVIYALMTPIDGVGNILAVAGPCVLRTQSRFPLIGVMRFDSDDVEALAINGRLPAVVLHEMLHVIGIPVLWYARGMLIGSGTTNPRFSGLFASARCISSGGLASCSDGRVPVENIGGSGTAESHWRESAFDKEVMTGFVEADADMPFSSMSIASLQDLGYVVNLLSADPFQVPVPGSVAPRLSPQLLAPWEILSPPVFEITPSGSLRPIVPR